MKEIGILYGTSSGNTESVAVRMLQQIGRDQVRVYDVRETSIDVFDNHDNFIIGTPTWGIGELPDDWQDFYLQLEHADLTGKTVALFGLGDQESYPDTFADALGALFDLLKEKNCRLIGSWPTVGYQFTESAAFRDNAFVGLVLDEENQAAQTAERIDAWLKNILPQMITVIE